MRVRAKYTHGPWKQGDEFDVIEETEAFYNICAYPNSCAGGWYKKHFDVIEELNPTQAAMKLLIDQGYRITPPKPKLIGKVFIYTFNGRPLPVSESDYNNIWTQTSKDSYPIIAKLDWTEGDGL